MDTKPTDGKDITLAWNKLYDRTRYLKSEHDLKEREYGIPWRSSYKETIIHSVSDLEKQKLFSEKASSSEQGFDIIFKAAQVVKKEVDSNQGVDQVDNLRKLREKYKALENHINLLKRLLKEQEPAKFESIKKEILV